GPEKAGWDFAAVLPARSPDRRLYLHRSRRASERKACQSSSTARQERMDVLHPIPCARRPCLRVKEVMLKSCAPAGKAGCTKLGIPALGNRPPRLTHQPVVVRQIVHRQQGWPKHFLREKQVMDVGPAELPAHRT